MSARDVEIAISDTTLRGKLFLPEGLRAPFPVVVLQSGLGGPADTLHPMAQVFVGAGLATLAYDHRYTGISDGEPRQLFDPWQQTRDLRHVITWLGLQPEVDKTRIGLWGISIGGANAMFVTAMDKRVKAAVSVIPPVSGWSARKLQPADVLAQLDAKIPEDRERQLQGGEALTIKLHGRRTPDNPVMFADEEGLEFIEKMLKASPSFKNAITLSTLDYLYEMEVRAYAERIDQPLLMVLADRDTVAPVEEAREMFNRVPEPKEKIEYAGQHYEILSNHLPEILQRTAKWLAERLSTSA